MREEVGYIELSHIIKLFTTLAGDDSVIIFAAVSLGRWRSAPVFAAVSLGRWRSAPVSETFSKDKVKIRQRVIHM